LHLAKEPFDVPSFCYHEPVFWKASEAVDGPPQVKSRAHHRIAAAIPSSCTAQYGKPLIKMKKLTDESKLFVRRWQVEKHQSTQLH
jgi:hypothetical protein